MEGWIKLYRKIFENPVLGKDSEHLAVWIYLLAHATHKQIPAIFKGEKIILNKGQLITGRKSIAAKLKIPESKIYRIIKEFKNEQQIEQQTSNKNSLITILNWSKYQSSEQQDETQMNNNWTSTEQQMNTNKNVKNEKNIFNYSFINKKEKKDFRPYEENDELDLFLKRRGVNNLNQFESLSKSVQDELVEDFFRAGGYSK